MPAGRERSTRVRWPASESLRRTNPRLAEGHYDRLSALAADLVSRKVDVIAIHGSPGVLEAKSATSTIPIVFVGGIDPVAMGLATSLGRPGGNLTGVALRNVELHPKRLELSSELVPRAGVIALLVNPNFPQTERVVAAVREAALVKKELEILKASTESEIDVAFAALVRLRARALIVQTDPVFFNQRAHLLTLASRHAVPTIYGWRELAEAGGLISYGSSFTAAIRLLGIYAGKILNGAKPADPPVQQPTTFELVVNLKTAQALGLTIPPSILARADEVIE